MNSITKGLEILTDGVADRIIAFDQLVMPVSNSELMADPEYATLWREAMSKVKSEWFQGGVVMPRWLAAAIVPLYVLSEIGVVLAENPIARTALTTLGLASCAGMAESAGNDAPIIDSDGDDIPDSLEGIIPVGTSTPESGGNGSTADVYVYHSAALGITANHGFDQNDNLLTIGLLRGFEVVAVSDPDGTTHVTLAGDLMGEPGS